MNRAIEILCARSRLLLVAPHGFPEDDENTGGLTREIAHRLGTHAVINEHYRKPRKDEGELPDKTKAVLDLNRCDQVEQDLRDEFLYPLLNLVRQIGHSHGSALVLWVHGIKDSNMEKAVGDGRSLDVHVAVGMGQGEPDRWTARENTAAALLHSLRTNTVKPIYGALALRGSDYCGWHTNIMNQVFLRHAFTHAQVQSLQLEIKYTGFRDHCSQEAAAAFADALAPFAGTR